MKHTVIYPGTFDPITNGHVDVIARDNDIFDHVIVAIGVNGAKKPLFSPEKRMEMTIEAVSENITGQNVDVYIFDDLLISFCKRMEAKFAGDHVGAIFLVIQVRDR